MSTKFSMVRDINGYNGFGILPTYDIQGTSLAVSAAQSFTVPSDYPNWIAIFTYTPGSNIWVSFTTTATVATTSVTSLTSVLNPSARQVKGGSTISVITADATLPFVCVEFQIIAPYQN
jgi:hypothetical protein